jgi:hypothetical protein
VFLEMGLYRSQIEFLVMFEVVQHYAFLNHSSRCLYKNYIQIGRLLRNRRGFCDRVLHFHCLLTVRFRSGIRYARVQTFFAGSVCTQC